MSDPSHNTGPTAGQRAPRRGVILCLLLGVWLGTAGWTFHTAKGTSYLSDDPAACVNCHITRDQFASWQKSSHHACATCNSCHAPQDFFGKWFTKARKGLRHGWIFTLGAYSEPIAAHSASLVVIDRNCRDCHQALVSELLSEQMTVGGSAAANETGGQCLHCHRQVGHGASW